MEMIEAAPMQRPAESSAPLEARVDNPQIVENFGAIGNSIGEIMKGIKDGSFKFAEGVYRRIRLRKREEEEEGSYDINAYDETEPEDGISPEELMYLESKYSMQPGYLPK